jgi:hypothetical protein
MTGHRTFRTHTNSDSSKDYLKILILVKRGTNYLSIAKANRLRPYREMAADYSET